MREGPTSSGRPSRSPQQPRVRQQRQVVLGALAEADARVHREASARDARGRRSGDRRLELVSDLAPARRQVVRILLHGLRRAAGVTDQQLDPGAGAPPPPGADRSPGRRHVVHERCARRRSPPRRPSALRVSIESATSKRLASASIEPCRARDLAGHGQLLRAGPRRLAADVEHVGALAPRARRPHRSPRSRSTASPRTKRPPSENESGVAFSTPMIVTRSGRKMADTAVPSTIRERAPGPAGSSPGNPPEGRAWARSGGGSLSVSVPVAMGGSGGRGSPVHQELQLLGLEGLALEQRLADPVERGAILLEQPLGLAVLVVQELGDLVVDLARLAPRCSRAWRRSRAPGTRRGRPRQRTTGPIRVAHAVRADHGAGHLGGLLEVVRRRPSRSASKTSSSAARPPMALRIMREHLLAGQAVAVLLGSMESVTPSAMPRGMIVTLWIGSACSDFMATSAWPASW